MSSAHARCCACWSSAQWPPPHWRARRSASTHPGYWQAETAATRGKTTMMILVIVAVPDGGRAGVFAVRQPKHRFHAHRGAALIRECHDTSSKSPGGACNLGSSRCRSWTTSASRAPATTTQPPANVAATLRRCIHRHPAGGPRAGTGHGAAGAGMVIVGFGPRPHGDGDGGSKCPLPLWRCSAFTCRRPRGHS